MNSCSLQSKVSACVAFSGWVVPMAMWMILSCRCVWMVDELFFGVSFVGRMFQGGKEHLVTKTCFHGTKEFYKLGVIANVNNCKMKH